MHNADKISPPATRWVCALLTGYSRFVSPMLGPHCRFYPSCSAYMRQSVLRFGVFRGGWIGLKRLARCHPLNAGGFDPVPERSDRRGYDGL